MDFTLRRSHSKDRKDNGSRGDVLLKLTKGGSGHRLVRVPRAQLIGVSCRDLAEMVVDGQDPSDAFVADARLMLDDHNYSLELIESGEQARHLDRSDVIDPAILQQDEVNLALSRDHTGGRLG